MPTRTENPWRSLTGGSVTIEYQSLDGALTADLHAHALSGRSSVEAFFGSPLNGAITLRVYPDRASLTTHWRSAWNQPDLQPECWMIASANDQLVVILTPRVWSSAACGHEGGNAQHVSRVIAHEIAHVLHRRVNTAPGFVGENDLWWFVEGVAVLASGQLDPAARSRVRALVLAGYSPTTPQGALNGSNGYDVVGSMVAFIDSHAGRG